MIQVLFNILDSIFGKEAEEQKNPKSCCPPPDSRLRTDGICNGCGQLPNYEYYRNKKE